MLGIGTALIQGWSEKEKKCWSLKRESYKDIHTRGIPRVASALTGWIESGLNWQLLMYFRKGKTVYY